jgi:putative membrane protein
MREVGELLRSHYPERSQLRLPPARLHRSSRLFAVIARLGIMWIFNAIALFVATWLLSGLSYGDDWWALLIAALVFTLANFFLKPVLTILSIPLIIVTLGVFYLLINVFMLYLTHWIVPQLTIASFWWALAAAIIVSVVNVILRAVVGRQQAVVDI